MTNYIKDHADRVTTGEATTCIVTLLSAAISSDYLGAVTSAIVHDVLEDLRASSAFPNQFTLDDVRLAIGRVLCRRLDCEV